MANRRMLSKDVISTDNFLELPLSAQALYMHLTIEADDDGFVSSPKRIQRTILSDQSDLDLLVNKGYLIQFDNIVLLTHWKVNNKIRSDRYVNTMYFDYLDYVEVSENETYVLKEGLNINGIPIDNQMTTKEQPAVNQASTVRQPDGNQISTNGQPDGNEAVDKGLQSGSKAVDKGLQNDGVGKYKLGEVNKYSIVKDNPRLSDDSLSAIADDDIDNKSNSSYQGILLNKEDRSPYEDDFIKLANNYPNITDDIDDAYPLYEQMRNEDGFSLSSLIYEVQLSKLAKEISLSEYLQDR